jgi:polyvinyl alcohol dehydrogenase (cytochrome)
MQPGSTRGAQFSAWRCPFRIDGRTYPGFSTEDGHLLWGFDTVLDYSTVNGVSAHGGSLDGAGRVIVDGIPYVNSGYPRFGGMPGNVLLAFSLDGK